MYIKVSRKPKVWSLDAGGLRNAKPVGVRKVCAEVREFENGPVEQKREETRRRHRLDHLNQSWIFQHWWVSSFFWGGKMKFTYIGIS